MVNYVSKFHWADYLLFAISLAIGVVVGIVLAIKEKWLTQSSESYLMGNRQMNWFLVAMSFLASIMNARLFVAFTTEFYYSGFIIIWLPLAYCVGAAVVMIFILPKFYRLGFNITSAYEYFEHRFNLAVRMVVSIFYFLLTLLYMSVTLYIPSLVLSQVSEINIYWSIFLGAAVCLLYTGFGGMKAVIWVDSIQILIIFIGMFALTIKGSIDAGGIEAVWAKYEGIGERSNWNDIDPAPENRYNVWNVIFLWGILMAGMMGADQSVLQRFMTIPSLRRAQASVVVGTIVGIIFLGQVAVLAMVIFASIGGNDPLITKQIEKADQIMPYFLMYSLGEYHGIPGLVVAALFAATLSTLSSGQNALAAVLLEDLIRPIHKLVKKTDMSDKVVSWTSRGLGLAVGVLVLAIAMAVPSMPGTVLEITLSVQSFILAPLLGLILVGFFMGWVESWGALCGLIASVAWGVMLWAGEREYSNKLGRDYPPLFVNNYTVPIRPPVPTAEPQLWDVSYTWYALLDILVLIIVSNIISLIVHLIQRCRIPGYSIRKTFPDKQFRYNMDDFLVAMGCRTNNVAYNTESDRNELEGEVEKPGLDNLAYDKSTNF